MSASNFDKSVTYVLAHEGGYVNDPRDPGGATNLGVTIAVLSGWLGRPATLGDVKNLSRDTAKKIYRRQYWDAVKGDDLPAGLDYMVFDYAVNSGPVRAKKTFQKVLPNYSNDRIDGNFGMVTIQAAQNVDDIHGLIDAYCDARIAFLKTLKGFRTYGKGWTTRTNDVRRIAKAMASTGVTLASFGDDLPDPATLEVCPSPRGEDAEVRPATNFAVQAFGAGGSTATLSGISNAASQAASSIQPLAETFSALQWIFIGLTLVSVGIGMYLAVRNLNTPGDNLS